MLYLPTHRLREGMALGLPLYEEKGAVWLPEGTTLEVRHLQDMARMGYPGAYVLDERFSDVAAQELLTDGQRRGIHQAAWECLLGKTSHRKTFPMIRFKKLILPLMLALADHPKRLVDLVDRRAAEHYTTCHSASVLVLSLLVGLEMGYSGNRLYELGAAALLHDIGTRYVPRHVLDRPGILNPDEYELAKSHCRQGHEYLRTVFSMPQAVCLGALQHHERFDGGGYPDGLAGEKISLFGRVIAATADYDALISPRPYRKEPMVAADALNLLEKERGTRYDPQVLDALRGVVAPWPAGVIVDLNTGIQCVVVENRIACPDRPLLRPVTARMPEEPAYIDLSREEHLRIAGVTAPERMPS